MVYIQSGRAYFARSNGSAKTLQAGVQLSGGSNLEKLWTQDVNGDQLDDLVAIDNYLTFYVWLSTGSTSGTPFGSPASYTLTYTSKGEGDAVGLDDLAFGDFDNDGDVDIVFASVDLLVPDESTSDDEGPDPQDFNYTGNYAIAANLGGGRFNAPALLDTYGTSSGEGAENLLANLLPRVTTGDFDNDGKLDLAFTYHTTVEWLTAPVTKIIRGAGTLSFDMTQAIGLNVSGAQDVQGIVPGAPGPVVPKAGVQAYLATVFDSSSHFQAINSAGTVTTDNFLNSTPRGPFGGPAADLNGDGQTDVIYADGNSSSVYVGIDWGSYSNSQVSHQGLVLGTDTQQGGTGDLDGDGQYDLVGMSGSTLYLYFNSTNSPSAIFYKDGSCSKDIGYVPTYYDGSYNLTGSTTPVPNDAASSMTLSNVKAGTTVTVYDSINSDGSGDTSDDWAVIQAITDVASQCIGTFETSVSTSTYSVTYHEHSGHSIDTHALDGKVSLIVVDAP